MKRMISIVALASIAVILGVVWENDPSFTPEQRKNAQQINENIRSKNKERAAEMNQKIADATTRFIDEINAIKTKYPPLMG